MGWLVSVVILFASAITETSKLEFGVFLMAAGLFAIAGAIGCKNFK